MATSDNPTPSASSPLTLLCQLVDNENLIGAVFPVDTSSTALVGHLKEQIWGKKTNTFTAHGIDADQLFLWKLSSPIPTGRTRTEKAEFSRRTKAIEFPDPESDDALEGNGTIQILDSAGRLSRYWQGDPREEHLHLIVQVLPPPAASSPESRSLHRNLKINCIIFGDDPDRVFTVKIPDTDNVSALKELIKDKSKPAFDHVPARALNPWKVNIDINQDPKSSLSSLEFREGVGGVEGLKNTLVAMSDIFPDPPSMHIHIVVERPDIGNRTAKGKQGEGEEGRDQISALEKRYNNVISGILKAMPPSHSAKSSAYGKSQSAYTIYDGRYEAESPRTTVALPVQLFHPAFGHFLDDIRRQDGIPDDIIRKTTQYMKAASAIYPTEDKRRDQLNSILIDVLDVHIQPIVNSDKTCPDGVVELLTSMGPAAILHEEDKNEIGDGGSDPSTQVGLTFARCWAQSKFKNVRDATCCPSFLIATAGPWVVVLGAVITDGVIIQRLTNFVWFGLDTVLNDSRIALVARIFYALKTNLRKLRCYYENLQPSPMPSRFFPSMITYRDGDKTVHFQYFGYLEDDPSCTAVHATTLTEPARHIVVKFVDRYGERAHHILADAGLAPKLLYCGTPQLDAGQPSYRSLRMIVMEYIDGSTLTAAKGKLDAEATERVRKEVRHALDLLHEKDLVFGDLRPPNVMITKAQKVKLIDFNWAGERGQVKYPYLISPSVNWPAGVKALDVIEFAHDEEMLKRLL